MNGAINNCRVDNINEKLVMRYDASLKRQEHGIEIKLHFGIGSSPISKLLKRCHFAIRTALQRMCPAQRGV